MSLRSKAGRGSKARLLLEWIYYAPDLPCLERKRAVWEEYRRV